MPTALHEFLTQALGVCALVAGLTLLARRGGTLLAGLATAALSTPTLVLLCLREGPAFARLAAVGTLLTTPVCAGLVGLALRWLARPPASRGQASAGSAWLPTLLAGLMSATVCTLAGDLGALGSGFVSGLPLVAAWTTLGTRRHCGGAAARRYVLAFRHGLAPRAALCAVFAGAVGTLGAPWSMGLALAAAALLAGHGVLRQAARRCTARPA